MTKLNTKIFGVFVAFALTSCATYKQTPKLELKSVYEIPYGLDYKNTEIGGLSGIDYDEKSDTYYIISDDRADKNNARVYTAKINLNEDQIQQIDFNKVIFLKDKSGKYFDSYSKNPTSSIDPEDIRYYPKTNSILWTNEGDRLKTSIQNPSIWFSNLDGSFSSAFDLPPNLNMSFEEKGPRRNGVLEGLDFFDHDKKVLTLVEEPLYEDGDRATTKNGGLIRLFEFDVKSGKNTAQYYYEIDPIVNEPIPTTAFSVNGASALLHVKKNTFWIVERSYSVGHASCSIRIYETQLDRSKKIKTTDLEVAQKNVLDKHLILNLDNLNIFVDNIEGITFGPRLSNGNKSLILVSDNNFSEKQKSQIFLFEIK